MDLPIVTFQKGQSGNPLGGNAKLNALARRMQGLTLKAADVIEHILTDPEATNGERLAAAKEVFDRAIGRPKQASTVEVTHNASPHLTALVGLAASVALRGSDAPVIDAQPIEIISLGTYDAQNTPSNVDVEGAKHGDE